MMQWAMGAVAQSWCETYDGYRLQCCVPFCRRTRGHRKNSRLTPGAVWICQDHWKLITRVEKRVYRRASRRIDPMADAARWRVFSALVRRAIERSLVGRHLGPTGVGKTRARLAQR